MMITLHDGVVVRARDSFSGLERALVPFGRVPHRYMRVGRFAIAVLDDNTLAISEEFEDQLGHDDSIGRDSEFWDDQLRDRSGQLDAIEERIVGHPLQRDVEEDICIERSYFA